MRKHDWRYLNPDDGYRCSVCGATTPIPDMGWPCEPPPAPITDIASARVAKAVYANAVKPVDCLRAAVAELEAGLPCTSLVIVIGDAGTDTASATLRIAGGANYFERLGLLDSAREILVRDAALPMENK